MKAEVIAMVDPKGTIVNYHIAYTKEILAIVPNIDSKREAGKLVGRKAIYTDGKGAKYVGKVSGLHGRKGTLKIKFKHPLPANSLGKSIEIQ